MADDLERQANAAFVDEDFETAVELFTKAIEADPNNAANLLTARAQAHIKLSSFTDAVADASRAIEINPQLPKAYLRKGVACFHLDEFETAKSAFTAGSKVEPSNKTLKEWIDKCDKAIAEEAGGLSQVTEANPSETSSAPIPSAENTPEVTPAALQNEEAVLPKQPLKFRHAFYQNAREVVVEIFAKGLKQEQVKVDFGVQFLNVVIDIPPNAPYVLQARLNQKVVSEKCRYNILGTKLEIRLAKAEELQWKTLEYDEKQVVAVQAPVVTATREAKLEYPTSSRKANKDWDKLEAEVKKQEKDEKLEGDAALNKLFRDIYSNADEDTRRAMNKSFVESNGTVLSTNWQDVGKKYVEGSPPSGMEMKKWEV